MCWPAADLTVVWRNGKGVCMRCRHEYEVLIDPFNEKGKE